MKSICFAGNMDENFLHFTGPLETEGARHIISVLLEPDPRPVWVQAWGGTNTIAQAISILEKDYRRKDMVRAKSKLKIFAIADQDSTSAWIREKHPEIFYIQSHQFTALNYQHQGHPFSDHEIFSDEWTTSHVKKDHGPLGNMYAQSYFSEGDSPAFFHLIGNGLRADTDPTWGGWGGRFVKQGANKYFSDAVDDGDRMHEAAAIRMGISYTINGGIITLPGDPRLITPCPSKELKRHMPKLVYPKILQEKSFTSCLRSPMRPKTR